MMANEKRLIDANLENADSCETAKIKSPFVKVIVTGSVDNPYYEILYYDPADGICHVGYSSFSIKTVFHYLSKVFDIVDAPTVDAVEVVHGRWIPLEYDGYADGNPVWDLWECSECQEEHSGDEDTLTPYCPICGAKMDGGNDNG